jgi:hypothetical protein
LFSIIIDSGCLTEPGLAPEGDRTVNEEKQHGRRNDGCPLQIDVHAQERPSGGKRDKDGCNPTDAEPVDKGSAGLWVVIDTIGDARATGLAGTSSKSECTRVLEMLGAYLPPSHTAPEGGETDSAMRRFVPRPNARPNCSGADVIFHPGIRPVGLT